MVSRRRFLTGSATALTALGTGLLAPDALAAAIRNTVDRYGNGPSGSDASNEPLTSFVDVFVGTGGHGHTFPGATLPFGMVQLSPDTNDTGWDACSGYHQGDGSIMGFSHTHLSGTGGADMLDVLLMPAQGEVMLDPGARGRPDINYHSRYDLPSKPGQPQQLPVDAPITPGPGYRSRFDPGEEHAVPGYYRVRLKDHDILAELTATERAGLHRYTFNQSGKGHLLLDFAHGYRDSPEVPCKVTDAHLKLIGEDTVVGSRHVHQWANGRHIYFAMKLSRPFAQGTLYSDDKALASGSSEVQGKHLKTALYFDNPSSTPLLVKVGISGVDIDGAMRNLDAELPGWDFEQVRNQANAAWERELSRIRVDSPSLDIKRIFYSSLYHTMLAPTLFSDVDGRYRGMDMAVHTLPKGQHNYSSYSLWDTYRAEHPLLTLFQPERVPDLVNGLIRMAAESPAGPAVWPLQGIETGTMIGWHSASVIAEAQAKGFPGIDIEKAWPIYRKRAFDDDYRGLPWYRKLGYDASDKDAEAVSKTLEYCYCDWASARLADAAGATDDANALRHRSQNYANVFDKKLGFVRPRAADGSWLEPFDPRAVGHSKKWRDFTESNAWEATFLNQHDLYHYMALFGGPAAFENKLDELFNMSSALPGDAPPDIAGMVGLYAHGNEPSHHVAYLYAYTGAHYKTQARVRMLLDTMYKAAPDGLAGNEDCGQMSAWYVMGALGLYAVDPVSTHYVFGSPLLARAAINVGNGRRLIVETRGNAAQNRYIQSVSWNAKPWTRSWIAHKDLAAGGTLVFEMGAQPNTRFGAAMQDRPPSFGSHAA